MFLVRITNIKRTSIRKLHNKNESCLIKIQLTDKIRLKPVDYSPYHVLRLHPPPSSAFGLKSSEIKAIYKRKTPPRC